MKQIIDFAWFKATRKIRYLDEEPEPEVNELGCKQLPLHNILNILQFLDDNEHLVYFCTMCEVEVVKVHHPSGGGAPQFLLKRE